MPTHHEPERVHVKCDSCGTEHNRIQVRPGETWPCPKCGAGNLIRAMIADAIYRAGRDMGKAAERQTHYHCKTCGVPVAKADAARAGRLKERASGEIQWTCAGCSK